MAAEVLIDTGAILALLERRDAWHESCVEACRQLRLLLLTTDAVLTELFHLFGKSRAEMESAWKFVASEAIILGGIEQHELPHVRALMSKYWGLPMDFADATLVYVAQRESISTIFTVDHADFSTYRIHGKQRFRILPSGDSR
jgi:uncharacterized protein